MDEAMEYNDVEEIQEVAPPANDPENSPPVVELSDTESYPQANAEPRAQAEENVDNNREIRAKKRKFDVPDEPPPIPDNLNDSADWESGQVCPICMDYWNNAGEHRLCCLKCGHLFGRSCVVKWLQVSCTASTRRCPQCNRKASVKDIRILYARKLSAVDTVELQKVKNELTEVTKEKSRLENEVSKCHLRQQLYDQQMQSMSIRITELQRQQTDMSERLTDSVVRIPGSKFHLEKSLEICKDKNCRVLDYNKWHRCIAVSQCSGTHLFAGYGVRKIDVESLQPKEFMLMHTKVVRDIAFHPADGTLLMSVSFDKTAKILDMRCNFVAQAYPTDSQLWSGCWSTENSNILLCGAQNGSVTEFDMRQTSGAVGVHATPGDRSPVVSLATVPSRSTPSIGKGGFIAAHLNTCYAYEHKDVASWTTKRMYLEGPFISVRYDDKNHHALVSSRPNASTPNVRHTVFTIESGDERSLHCNIIHTINGGNSQQIMSRPCHINVRDDTLVAFYQESTKTIPLWSVASGQQIYSLTVSDPVTDMRSFESNNQTFLATLSGNKLRLYNYDD